MDSRYAWLIGGCLGLLTGYVFGFSQGDVWAGVVLVPLITVSVYGFLAFPEYRTRWSGQSSRFWYTVFGVLGVVAITGTLNSPSVPYSIQLSIIIAAIWTGGVFTGVALERSSASNPETKSDPPHQRQDPTESDVDHY